MKVINNCFPKFQSISLLKLSYLFLQSILKEDPLLLEKYHNFIKENYHESQKM